MPNDITLADRMQTAQSSWRRTPGDYFLTGFGLFASLTVLVVALGLAMGRDGDGFDLSGWSPSTPVNFPTAVPGGHCSAITPWETSGRVLLLVAQSEEGPLVEAFRESLASYFKLDVPVITTADYTPDQITGTTGLVVLGNGGFDDPTIVRQAMVDAAQAAVPIGWVGLGGAAFADELGLTFDPTKQEGVQALAYNGVEIPVENQPFATQYPAKGGGLSVLGTAVQANGDNVPAIVARDGLVYAGYLPFNGNQGNLSLSAIIDSLSTLFGEREPDPRVLLRLEDINAVTYGPGETAFTNTTQYLLEQKAFMHLGIIPEAVNEDQSLPEEEVIADIGAAISVVQLVLGHPEAVEVVQHGFRHSRRDPRNEGCSQIGCATEFFVDDDSTMGVEASAAFARTRLSAGREVLERHLGNPFIYEAPHYQMSPAQTQVAQEMYPVLFYPIAYHNGAQTDFFLPWFTNRGGAMQGPSDTGYVAYDNPLSVDDILQRLENTAKVLADPVVVVFFHPFMSQADGREDDLRNLVKGIRAQGYRFASACAELAAPE